MSLADGPDGIPNGSYQFHGNNKSYIEFPNNGSLNAQQSITMLCWVYFTSNTEGPLFFYGNNRSKFVGMYIDNNELVARFTYGRYNLSTELKVNQWHYVGASYDHVTGNASLWVNGTKHDRKTFKPNLTLATEGQNVTMGSVFRFHFEGRITSMQVYNVALTQEQIKNMTDVMKRGKDKNCM